MEYCFTCSNPYTSKMYTFNVPVCADLLSLLNSVPSLGAMKYVEEVLMKEIIIRLVMAKSGIRYAEAEVICSITEIVCHDEVLKNKAQK